MKKGNIKQTFEKRDMEWNKNKENLQTFFLNFSQKNK